MVTPVPDGHYPSILFVLQRSVEIEIYAPHHSRHMLIVQQDRSHCSKPCLMLCGRARFATEQSKSLRLQTATIVPLVWPTDWTNWSRLLNTATIETMQLSVIRQPHYPVTTARTGLHIFPNSSWQCWSGTSATLQETGCVPGPIETCFSFLSWSSGQ